MQVVGTLFLAVGKPRDSDSDASTVATVTNVAVEPAGRRRGVGRALMAAAMEEAAARGARTMALSVMADNEGAVRFYEKMGMRVAYRVTSRMEPV